MCFLTIDKHYEKFHAYLQYSSHGRVYQYMFLVLLWAYLPLLDSSSIKNEEKQVEHKPFANLLLLLLAKWLVGHRRETAKQSQVSLVEMVASCSSLSSLNIAIRKEAWTESKNKFNELLLCWWVRHKTHNGPQNLGIYAAKISD